MSQPSQTLQAPPPRTDRQVAAPEVALPWLVRLRWVAVMGQALTIVLVGGVLELSLPWLPLVGLMATTLATNLLLFGWRAKALTVAKLLVPAILVLDTLLFTALLYHSGGPENPFSLLYVIHVAMATVTLGWSWTWFMVVLSAVCYGALFYGHVPLPPLEGGLELPLYQAGSWFCLILVATVMAYFVGRVMGALREREEQLASMRDVAARNERLASLSTLAAGAAHELGTPLGTIAIVARELERAAERLGEDALQEDARLVRGEVDRCRRILDRMSARGGEVAGRMVPERLTPSALLEGLRAELGDGAERVELVGGAVTELVAPREDLEEALLPLLRNGLHAAPGEPVELAIGREAGRLRFSVRDRGQGMDEATLARAGEPFYTTKQPGEGTGLGLHLVRLLAERLGGELALTSRLGGGTTATLEFPEPQVADQEEAVGD